MVALSPTSVTGIFTKVFFPKNSNACGFTWGDDSWDNFQKYRFNGFLTNDIDEFIRKRYKKNDRIYKYFITNKKKPVPFYINEIYICRWEYFEEIVGCISDFIDYIDKKYELNGDPQEWHYFVLDNFIDRKLTDGIPENETWWFEKNCRNFWRVVANWIELFEGVYFGHLTQELGLPIYEVPNGTIEFDHVSFSYKKDSQEPVLKDIHISINSGETIGIIGGSNNNSCVIFCYACFFRYGK